MKLLAHTEVKHLKKPRIHRTFVNENHTVNKAWELKKKKPGIQNEVSDLSSVTNLTHTHCYEIIYIEF